MQEDRTDQGKFARLKAKLAAKGASNPAALAAYICRKKGEGGSAKKKPKT